MSRRKARDAQQAVIVVVALLVLGVLGGVVWSLVVTPAVFTKLPTRDVMGEDQVGLRFGADGWYVVIGVLTAFVAGAVLARWRSGDLLVTCAALVVGGIGAAVVMAVTGHLLGPDDPQVALATAEVGARVPESLDVGMRAVRPFGAYLRDTVSVYLAWPVGVLAGALVVLLGPGGDDDGPRGSHEPGWRKARN